MHLPDLRYEGVLGHERTMQTSQQSPCHLVGYDLLAEFPVLPWIGVDRPMRSTNVASRFFADRFNFRTGIVTAQSGSRASSSHRGMEPTVREDLALLPSGGRSTRTLAMISMRLQPEARIRTGRGGRCRVVRGTFGQVDRKIALQQT
jgi:hypothetical protein